MFPILLSDNIPFLHYCICFVVSEFYVQRRVMFIVYCVLPTESLCAGLTKGTACNKDLRSQKLHSEAAGRRGADVAVNGLQR